MTLIFAAFLIIYFLYFVLNAPVLLASLSGDFDSPAWKNYTSRFVPVENPGARRVAASVVLLLGTALIYMWWQTVGETSGAWLFLPEGTLLTLQGVAFFISFRAYASVQSFAASMPVLFLWVTLVPKILALGGMWFIYLT